MIGGKVSTVNKYSTSPLCMMWLIVPGDKNDSNDDGYKYDDYTEL